MLTYKELKQQRDEFLEALIETNEWLAAGSEPHRILMRNKSLIDAATSIDEGNTLANKPHIESMRERFEAGLPSKWTQANERLENGDYALGEVQAMWEKYLHPPKDSTEPAGYKLVSWDYTSIFNAIAAATSIYAKGAGINISVQKFQESLIASAPTTPK